MEYSELFKIKHGKIYILVFGGENMGKTGITVQGIDEKIAKKIVKTFVRERIYLETLVGKYVPKDTRISVNKMDYSQLLHCGYVVCGVANKILKNSSKKKNLEQLSIFS